MPKRIMAAENAVEIKSILNETEVSLILDTYDDIFSDFDPRPYNSRSLSEDFLAEAKRATRDKGAGLELRFLIPKDARNASKEALITQRLREHFRKHNRLIKKERIKSRRRALTLIAIGVVIGMVDALTLSAPGLNAILTDPLGIVLTPASWYTIWNGFDRLIARPRDEVAEEEFYRKMVSAHITFTPY